MRPSPTALENLARKADGAPLGKGHSAVRAMKRPRLSDGEPWQKLELFPTPPWATRAFCEHVVPLVTDEPLGIVWEPAAGLGHMSGVLREYAGVVSASDVYSYPLVRGAGDTMPLGITLYDFLHGLPEDDAMPDWIITNPPFTLADKFLSRALAYAEHGVAFLLRMQWLETEGRYRDVYLPHPPSLIAPFVERVPMCEGGYDPDGDTATMYAWFVWARDGAGAWPKPLGPFSTIPTFLIPWGLKAALTRENDRLLAQRCVPGFIPPSRIKRVGKNQLAMEDI